MGHQHVPGHSYPWGQFTPPCKWYLSVPHCDWHPSMRLHNWHPMPPQEWHPSMPPHEWHCTPPQESHPSMPASKWHLSTPPHKWHPNAPPYGWHPSTPPDWHLCIPPDKLHLSTPPCEWHPSGVCLLKSRLRVGAVLPNPPILLVQSVSIVKESWWWEPAVWSTCLGIDNINAQHVSPHVNCTDLSIDIILLWNLFIRKRYSAEDTCMNHPKERVKE